MNRNLSLALAAFVSFTAYSVWCVDTDPLGFVPLLSERWGIQFFWDIANSLVLATLWLIPDARKRGINPWPYVVLCLPLGSIAALAYAVHRNLRDVQPAPRPAAA